MSDQRLIVILHGPKADSSPTSLVQVLAEVCGHDHDQYGLYEMAGEWHVAHVVLGRALFSSPHKRIARRVWWQLGQAAPYRGYLEQVLTAIDKAVFSFNTLERKS